ncbi:transposase [Aquisalimonas asiatica]
MAKPPKGSDAEAARSPVCAACDSQRVVRNGRRPGLQRWLCRDCGKTSNATSGTPLSRLRGKELFAAYAECMRRGMTIRATARELGVTIDNAFRWRRRFLENAVNHQPEKGCGLLDVGETYFRRSQKGSRKMARAPRRYGGGQGCGGHICEGGFHVQNVNNSTAASRAGFSTAFVALPRSICRTTWTGCG